MPAPLYLPESKQDLLTELTQDLTPDALNWLSGYLAGIAQGAQPRPLPAPAVAAAQAADARQPLTILYGSQTGNAQRLAASLAERTEKLGLPTILVRADAYSVKKLKQERLLYIVISTQGDGDPPDDSLSFVEFLQSRRAPKLPQLKYAVLGLGDSSYPIFCATARHIDARLAELGAARLIDLATADLDIETVARPWRDKALEHAQSALGKADAPLPANVTPLRPRTVAASRDNPYLAELLAIHPITAPGSSKDIRHLEISLEGSQLSYRPGDALGVWPVQADALVSDIAAALGLDGDAAVDIDGVSRPLREWLGRHRELTRLTRPFLAAHAERADSAELRRLLQEDSRDALRELLETRQLIDVLQAFPAAWTATDLVRALRPLTPRMYSIASSQASVEDEVHLTLANVAYDIQGNRRWGAASNYLTSLEEGSRLPVFIEQNTRFRLPEDPSRDIIMIGPGTGVAPFRGFVQERGAQSASGRNWLFFGNPNFSTDFLYQTEWQRALTEGALHRLDLAFSRDQEHKIYVQDRLIEQAADVYDWIQGGAHVYVCGDATRMARDVQNALLRIARTQGNLDEAGAKQWLDGLAAQGRYARDIY